MSDLFLSDLHLCSDRPDITRQFERFLDGVARQAKNIYILGDLFEYWAGDDDIGDPFNRQVASALADCSRYTRIFLMHGNRDFLIGEDFARTAGLTLIKDPIVISICERRTLLMHGDTLCTDDIDYQRFRKDVRSPAWASQFMALPLAERKRQIEALRAQSQRQKDIKHAAIMDVNAAAVTATFRKYELTQMIHGHTHLPAYHPHDVDGHICERWVLADWYKTGSYLECDAKGCRSIALA